MHFLLIILFVSANYCFVISTNTTTFHGRGGKCILLAKPEALKNRSGNISQQFPDIEIREILDHPVQAVTVSFISHSSAFKRNLLQSRAPPSNSAVCCQVIGVVGEFDSKTASIIHTLASRSNLNLTLVASTSLPVANPNIIPNIFDMNPLEHYIDALVSFTNELNWTRIGLISDGADINILAAEKLQMALLRNSERSITLY